MQDKLVIYLHAHDLENPSWATDFYTHHGETDSLAQIAMGREVVLIVPAEDVVLMNVPLPKMKRSRLRLALPFALEEQCIDDVENLHFAIGEYQKNGDLPVAVVAHEKMRRWLALLYTWNIQANTIIPATLALPFEDATWHVLLQDMAVVRTGMFQGFAVDKNNFIEMFQLGIETHSCPPQLIRLYNYTDHVYAKMLNVTTQIKEEFLESAHLMSDLVRRAINTSAFNLLQGPYAVKTAKFPKLKLRARVVVYLFAMWVFLLFFYPCVSCFILKHRINILDNQIGQIYQHNFPQANSLVAPRARMQEKLHNLSRQSGESRALVLMGVIGKGMLAVKSIQLKRFDFQNNHLMLELTSATAEDFSTFADYLTQQGLNVKQQNADFIGGRTNAMLQVE